MTVSSTNNKATYVGNGALTVFSYTYRMDNDDDMEVYLNEILQPSGYTVNRNIDNIGGDVTFDVAPTLDTNITLLRVIDQTQETDYVPYDPFPAESHEDALDKLTMLVQQLQENIDRNTQAIGGEDGVDTQAPEFQANKAWKWSDGNPDKKLVNSTYDPDEQASLAAGYANDALNSAGNASTSEGNALDSEDKAYQWSENPEDVPVEPGEYSAHHWAIKAAGNAAGVSSVNGQSGVIVLDKTWVGLDDVDNTSDADKPISDATQLALDDKTDVAQVTTIAEESAVAMAIALG